MKISHKKWSKNTNEMKKNKIIMNKSTHQLTYLLSEWFRRKYILFYFILCFITFGFTLEYTD